MTIWAITIWQPWASLIVEGHKRYETRPWSTPYRGPIAIHAAKRNPMTRRDGLPIPTIRLIASKIGPFDTLPLGAVIAIADLVTIKKTDDLVKQNGFLESDEYMFGDFSPDRYAWDLNITRRINPPISERGKQGLWSWQRPLYVA